MRSLFFCGHAYRRGRCALGFIRGTVAAPAFLLRTAPQRAPSGGQVALRTLSATLPRSPRMCLERCHSAVSPGGSRPPGGFLYLRHFFDFSHLDSFPTLRGKNFSRTAQTFPIPSTWPDRSFIFLFFDSDFTKIGNLHIMAANLVRIENSSCWSGEILLQRRMIWIEYAKMRGGYGGPPAAAFARFSYFPPCFAAYCIPYQ